MHLHASEDTIHHLSYNAKELIDEAAKFGFEVLSFTFHNKCFFNKEIFEYAKKKSVLLVSGVEKEIEGKEVLIYNISKTDIKKLNTFSDLRNLKKNKGENILIIAPHPYFILPNCLGKKLVKNIDLFDAIEYSHFYLSFLNRNKKAVRVAKKFNKAIIGTSDAHNFNQLNHTYSLINSKQDVKSVFEAIRKKNVVLKTKPLSFSQFVIKTFKVLFKLE